ncbi:unnamed protein product, partial [Didymodactylos carnosus]
IQARYVIAIWTFLGFVCLYMLRVNLSVAIVAMVTPQNVNETIDECKINTSKTNETVKHDFDWNPHTQGFVLGAFFYGYVLTQLIGGYLSERFGGKWIFGCGILGAGLLTMLIPIAAKTHVGFLIVVRVLIGVFEGPAFPSSAALWGQWVPPLERSIIPPIAHAGKEFGNVVTTPLAGLLCSSSFLGGWPSAFYVFGIITCIWFAGWCYFVYNNPNQHPRISVKERIFLTNCLPKPVKLKTPWKAILTSAPFWSIAVASTCIQFVYYVLLTSLPTYFATILKFNLQKNGVMFAIPYIFILVVIVISGQLADCIRARHILSTTNVRKLQTIIGKEMLFIIPRSFSGVGSSTSLILIGYVNCNHVAAVICVTCAVAFIGFHSAGCQISHLDIAANHAGTLVGITNTLASIPGFVGPYVVGAITNGNQTIAAWRKIFNLSGGIGLFGCIVYCILFNGEEQKWNRNEGYIQVVVKQEDDDDLIVS